MCPFFPPPDGSWDEESWEGAGFFTVKGDYEHELPLVIALAGTCGQLVIYPDTGAVAVIVDSADDAATVTRPTAT